MKNGGVNGHPDGDKSVTPAQPMPRRWLVGLTGLAFVMLEGATLLVAPRMPEAGAPPSVVVTYIEAHQRGLEWSWFLGGEVAWLPGLVFCALMTVGLWQESAKRAAALAGFGGAAVAAAMTLAVSVPWGLLVYLGPQLESNSSILLLAETRHFGDAALSIPLAVMLLGYGMASLRLAERRWVAISAVALLGALLECLHTISDFALNGQTGVLLQLSTTSVLVWALVVSLAVLTPRRQSRDVEGGNVDVWVNSKTGTVRKADRTA
jgi:hypothetical protein